MHPEYHFAATKAVVEVTPWLFFIFFLCATIGSILLGVWTQRQNRDHDKWKKARDQESKEMDERHHKWEIANGERTRFINKQSGLPEWLGVPDHIRVEIELGHKSGADA